jgi:hypothetical protein
VPPRKPGAGEEGVRSSLPHAAPANDTTAISSARDESLKVTTLELHNK